MKELKTYVNFSFIMVCLLTVTCLVIGCGDEVPTVEHGEMEITGMSEDTLTVSTGPLSNADARDEINLAPAKNASDDSEKKDGVYVTVEEDQSTGFLVVRFTNYVNNVKKGNIRIRIDKKGVVEKTFITEREKLPQWLRDLYDNVKEKVTKVEITNTEVQIDIDGDGNAEHTYERSDSKKKAIILREIMPEYSPVVNSIYPACISQGQTAAVTILGKNFVCEYAFDPIMWELLNPGKDYPVAKISFNPPTGIKITSVNFVKSTELHINITVAKDAPSGPRDLTVTNPDRRSCNVKKGLSITSADNEKGPKVDQKNDGDGNEDTKINGSGAGGGATVSASCDYRKEELLRTVVSPWRKKEIGPVEIIPKSGGHSVAVYTITWERDVANEYRIFQCTLKKGHTGPHHGIQSIEYRITQTVTEEKTYYNSNKEDPPEHYTNSLPQVDIYGEQSAGRARIVPKKD